uniref:beta-defensin 114 n=1 Tax=Jaculus jaculus TaxID=51337 RepID=UPI001E1B31A8|nr:beta-defensin 114 [Jaculus jaculus]
MHMFYYFLQFLISVTFIVPTTGALLNSEHSKLRGGSCERNCQEDEKQADICLSPRMTCCTER